MREIKFRAWSIKDNSYINGCNMYGFVLGQGAPKEILERYDSKWKKGEFLLEQFTGLKDKNGKEIYEGDIVIEKSYPMYDEGLCNYRCVVVWYDEEANFGLEMYVVSARVAGRSIPNGISEYRELEIIGNASENPELLKEQQ